MDTIDEDFKRIADLPLSGLVSEEDVKIKIVLPMLRALGYGDGDFNYEGKTGRGYVDVVVEHFLTGIVVEAKAPTRRLDQHIEQLENYIFNKHGRDRATIGILTNGELFNIYGVTEAFHKGSLEDFRVLSFRRSEMSTPSLKAQIVSLLAKRNNELGSIPEAISSHQRKKHDRLGQIEAELRELIAQRQQLDTRIQELEAEKTSILGSAPRVRHAGPSDTNARAAIAEGEWKHAATPHIFRLLTERGASRSAPVERKWLDTQLINKVERVANDQAVSFGLIELKKKGVADYEGKPIRRVWLA